MKTMSNIFLVFLLVIIFSGCLNKKTPVVTDPCAKAPTVCWGKVGQNPADNPKCAELIACYNWELVDKTAF